MWGWYMIIRLVLVILTVSHDVITPKIAQNCAVSFKSSSNTDKDLKIAFILLGIYAPVHSNTNRATFLKIGDGTVSILT